MEAPGKTFPASTRTGGSERSESFGRDDLPLIEKVADEAFRWICANAKSTSETPTEAVEEVLAEANV